MKKTFLGAVLAAPAAFAVAAPLQIPTNVPVVEVLQQTNTYNYTPVNETNSTIKRVVPISDALVTGQSVSDVEPKVSSTRRLPIGNGAEVTAHVKIPKANIAKALILSAKLGGRVAGGVVGGIAVDALIDYGLKNVKIAPDGTLTAEGESQKEYPQSDGYFWAYNNDENFKERSKDAACMRVMESNIASYTIRMVDVNFGYCDLKTTTGTVIPRPIFRLGTHSCPVGHYLDGDSCTPTKPASLMSEQELEDWIATRDGWPSSAARALQGMLGDPSVRPAIFTPDLDQNLSLQGPNSATGKTTKTTEPVQLVPGTNTVAPPGTPSSQTQPGTKTTTTTKTHPITYSGNSVSYTTNNTTTNTITNNVTNVTTNETKTEEVENDKDDQMAVDTPLPDVPKLYEKKYPDGLLGVWDAKKSEFEQTSFFRLIDQLTPKIGQAGSCPSWSIDLSWTPGGSMGVHQLQPPCMIWPILKAIVIISALFLARALIFGG